MHELKPAILNKEGILKLVLKKISISTSVLMLIGLALILIAGFRPIGFDHDSTGYVTLLNMPFEGAKNFIRLEPTFWLISYVQKILFSGYTQAFFVIYAVLGVSIKLSAIRRLSAYPIFSVIVYVALFFLLQEYTEIRVGVAAGIFLLAVPDIVERNRFRYFLKTGIAILFHYSAVITPFIYFLNPRKLNKLFYLSLPFLGMIFLVFNSLIVRVLVNHIKIFPEFLYAKLYIYINLVELNKVHVFNLYFTSLLILYVFIVFVHEKMTSKFDIILIKIFGWALFSFYSLTFNAALAFRISGLLLVVLIVLIPNVAALFKQKVITFSLTFMMLSIYFVYISIAILNW